MKVLVTGGTGFVGRAVLRELHDAGHRIRVLVRDARSTRVCEIATRLPIDVRQGNVLEPTSLDHALADVDAVIHLVGIISEVGQHTFENVHTRATQNVVTAAQLAGVKRFIHMSALGTRANAVARYHQTKWAAEEIVRNSGLAWTIFRPSIIYGPGDGFVNLFAKLIRRSPIVPILGGGGAKLQPVAVESVATAFVKSLTEPRAVGHTFDLCGVETFSLNTIVDEILTVMNRKRLKLHLPLTVAKVQAAILELLFGKLCHAAPPLSRDQLLMLQEDNVGEAGPATELFGLKPGSFREGISRYLNRGS